MAPADTIIKSVSERPNGMFPPGNHVRTCGKSVRPGRSKKELTESGTYLITLLRCFPKFLSFEQLFNRDT